MRAQSRTEIRRLLERHHLQPRKALGQHFLADPNIVDRIVRLAGVGPGDRVVEIGAGTGSLTRALAATGAVVVAYEIDTGLRGVLEEATIGLGVDLRFRDASAVDLCGELSPGQWTMVANLPYNVGTVILLDALREASCIERFVVMLQLEVADRLVATPGSKAYGLPSVVVGLHASVRIAFRVPRQVFVPPPDVDSAVVHLERREADPLAARAIELASAGFGQRRKMLRRSLASAVADPEPVLQAAGIDPTRRGEELGVDEWLRLAAAGSG